MSQFSEISEKIVCKLKCGNDTGTAFLLTPEIAITATHCIAGHLGANKTDIDLEFCRLSDEIINRTAKPLHSIENHNCPIVLLKLNEVISQIAKEDYIGFTIADFAKYIELHAYGYPLSNPDGLGTKMQVANVSNKNSSKTEDYDITLSTTTVSLADYSGLSGSPVYKGEKLVGVMLCQKSQRSEARTLGAITASFFETYLKENDVQCLHEIQAETVQGQFSLESQNQISTLQIENSNLIIQNTEKTNTITDILKPLYKEISLAISNHDFLNGWNKLKGIVEDPENQTRTEFADFFILALNRSLSFRECEDSQKYYDIVRRLKPDFNMQLFDVAFLKMGNKYDDAEKMLLPMTSIEVFNSYIMLLSEQKRYGDLEQALSENTFEYNITTHTILSIAYMENSSFVKAAEHADYLVQHQSASPVSHFIRGMITLWQNTPAHDYTPRLNVPIILVKLYITKAQQENLKKALSHFETASDLARKYENADWLQNSITGCMTVSALLGEPTITSYCDELFKLEVYFPAIHFMTENNIPISLNVLEKLKAQVLLEQAKPVDILALIKYYLKQGLYADAKKLVDKYEELLKGQFYDEFITTSFHIEIGKKCKDTSRAKEIVEQSNLSEALKDRLLIQLSAKTRTLRNFVQLKDKYQTTVDYYNLCFFCVNKRKWTELEKYSVEWYEKFGELLALDYKIKALVELHNYEECLQVLDYFQQVSTVTMTLKRIRIDCLLSLSRFDEALVLLKEVGTQLTEQNVLNIFFTQTAVGDNLGAISTLKAYLEDNPKSRNVTNNLVALLKAEGYDDEAFECHQRLAKQYPRDKELLARSMHLGLRSSKSFSFHENMRQMTKLDKSGKYFKVVNLNDKQALDEVLKMMEDGEKRNQEFLRQFLPVHMYPYHRAEFVMSDLFFKQWKNNGFLFYWHSCIREATSYAYDSSVKNIVMDYTALLSAHCLGLFDILERHFEHIYVAPQLLQCMTKEKQLLKEWTPLKLTDSERKIIEFIKTKLKILMPPASLDLTADENQNKRHLWWTYKCATAIGAVVVLTSQKDKMSEYIVGDMAKSSVEISAIINFITDNSTDDLSGLKIVVDRFILAEIEKQIPLEEFVGRFSGVYAMTDREYYEDSYQTHLESIAWFDNLIAKIKSLQEKGFLSFLPTQDITLKMQKNEDLLVNMALQAMEFARQKDYLFWTDDSFFNCYQSKNSVGIVEILGMFKSQHTISEAEHIRYIDMLLEHNFGYYIPNNDYVYNCLLSAKTENGILVETLRLTKIRHAVSRMLYVDSKAVSFLGEKLMIYVDNLRINFIALLERLWLTDKKSPEWKVAASDWLIYAFPVFLCDMYFVNPMELDRQIAVKYVSLITTYKRLTTNSNFKEVAPAYYQWIFQHLYEYWLYNPTSKELLVNMYAESIHSTISESIASKAEFRCFTVESCFRLATMHFPEDLQGAILQHSIFNHKFDKIFVVEQKRIDIVERQFQKVETDNLYQYLNEHPKEWCNVFDTVIHSFAEATPLDTLIKFMKEFMLRYPVEPLPVVWRSYFAELIWEVPTEQRLTLLNFIKTI